MAKIIELPTHSDERGSLTVIEKCLPFEIKRLYYIYDAVGKRGGHKHQKTCQALISVKGSCDIFVDDGNVKNTYILDKPNKCLLLNPEDWHSMLNFTSDCVLLVLASEYFDKNDYIEEEYVRD
jgi:dTDP-4-dehydrorhamnose 3,5-epimerase-like enzyme